jgi:hypothetical protein
MGASTYEKIQKNISVNFVFYFFILFKNLYA